MQNFFVVNFLPYLHALLNNVAYCLGLHSEVILFHIIKYNSTISCFIFNSYMIMHCLSRKHLSCNISAWMPYCIHCNYRSL